MNNFDHISNLFGNEIRKLRIEAGYKSYEQFAEDHDISRIQYWKMENGNNFTLKSLLKVLNGLNIDFNDFIKSPSLLNPIESEFAVRLRQIIKHVNLSKKAFSISIGYKNTTLLNNVLSGRNQISDTLTKKITAKYVSLNSEWIKTGSGKMLQ